MASSGRKRPEARIVVAATVVAALALMAVGSGATAASASDRSTVVSRALTEASGSDAPASPVREKTTPTSDISLVDEPGAAETSASGRPSAEDSAWGDYTTEQNSGPAQSRTPDDSRGAAMREFATAFGTLAVAGSGFGDGSNFTGLTNQTGTVLGAAGVPSDLGVANKHFVYFPVPSGSTSYDTGVGMTLSMSKFVDGDAGSHALGIRSDGVVFGWGGNRYGQLGTGQSGAGGGAVTIQTPTQVSTLPGGMKFVQVSAGGRHSLALSSTGDIYAWGGQNSSGQLGQGNTATIANGQASALKVNVPGVKFKYISAGNEFSLAVATDGSVYAWGLNSNGTTTGVGGNGTPAKVAGLSNINSVSAGYQHAAAISSTGNLYMWGYQFNGRLGNGQTTGVGAVQQVGAGTTWKQVDTGVASTWAVATDGRLFAWGQNTYYQLGTGNNTDQSRPSQVDSGVRQVSGATYAAASVKLDGRVMATGTNTRLQLGVSGAASSLVRMGWTAVSGVSGATDVSAGLAAVGARGGPSAQSWGNGIQTGSSNGTQAITAPGQLVVIGAPPTQTWVAVDSTIADAQAKGSTIQFGVPGASGTVSAMNIAVVTNAGTRYIRGDVPPHTAGRVSVYLKVNDGTSGSPTDTGLTYLYTFKLKIVEQAVPSFSDQPAKIVATTADSAETQYVGNSLAFFSTPAVSGVPTNLRMRSGYVQDAVAFSNGESATWFELVTPTPPVNDGTDRWRYDTEAVARTNDRSEIVSRNPLAKGSVRFVPRNFNVYLWKTGKSVSNVEVGMSGSNWKVFAESTSAPGRPNLQAPVTGFASEITNPNTSDTKRKSGWFSASLLPGTYWLTETKAPTGFQLMSESLQFTVSSTGAVSLGLGKGAQTTVTGDWTGAASGTTTIVVHDVGKIPLPEAGSRPIVWVAVVGLVLLILSCLLATRRFVSARRRTAVA